MGGKASIFEICKGSQAKEKLIPMTELFDLDKKICGPTDDLINTPQGYKYFSEQEEKNISVKHRSEDLREVIAPSKWQTSEIIGQGSFGRVLFSANLETGELMAVKQIPLIEFSYGTAHERIKEIQEEVDILSRLRHKNIVRYLGTKKDDQYLMIFMEYVAGGTISSLLNKYGKFNETLIRVYTQQILEGLEYLHYNKIIHRDIKGANMLVGNDGVCKLADFGSAKRFIGLEDKAQFKSLKGTTNWMAPEVMRQEGHGRFADIWSLGCLVLEMATGKPPWYYKTNQIAVFMHVCTTDESPHLPPELSDIAKDFILSCFKRKPSDRPNVCKLLRHPFINTLGRPKLEISMVRGEENYASNSTKFSTIEQKFRFDPRIDLSIVGINERHSIDNFEDMNPEHAVKAPFHDIITTAKFKAESQNCEGIEIYLGRLSNSSNDSDESKRRESVSSNISKSKQ